MSGQESDAERPHEATQRKLDEARKRGEIPKSTEVTGAAAMLVFLALAAIPGRWLTHGLGDLSVTLWDRAEAMGADLLSGGMAPWRPVFLALGSALAPAALAPAAVVLLVLLAMRGLVFAPEKLAPKLSRISPIANAKQKFGAAGLMEFAKSTVKLAAFCAVLWLYLWTRLPAILDSVALEPGQITAKLSRLLVEFLALVVLVMALIGVLDYLWQRFDHLRQQRMTDQEMRDEHKESEGDPHMKQSRRARAQALASNRMLADVPTATVVIVNPTHYAVALRWSPDSPGAPVCVAKGVDEIAATIRALATEHGVPIQSDPPTARALYATTRVGDEIAPDHYRAVAAAIRFADAMRRKAGRGTPPKGAPR